MLKAAISAAVCASVLGLAACSQTYTASDGTTKTTNVPTAVVNADQTMEAFASQKLAVKPLSSRSNHLHSVSKVEATGFEKRGPFFSVLPIHVSNEEAANIVSELTEKANLTSSNGNNILSVHLDKLGLGGDNGEPGTAITMTYTLKNKSGEPISSFTESSVFHVPFKAAPLGALRGRLEFAGSFENNVVQFTQELN